MVNKIKFALVSGLLLFTFQALPVKAALHTLGTNIIASDGTVYTITTENNLTVRRPYTSGGAFLSFSFNNFQNLATASAEDLALPIGSFISPQDGKIICSDRGSDKGTCYLITAGKKAGFTSSGVFTSQGYNFTYAASGDVSFLASTSNIDTPSAAHEPGALVNKDGTVYLVGSVGLLGIPSWDTLLSWGYSSTDIVPANAADRTVPIAGIVVVKQPGQISYPTTTPIGFTPPPAPPPVPPTTSVWITDPPVPIDPILLQWSTTRKLTWNDFRGIPPSNTISSAGITPSLNATAYTSHQCVTQAGTSACTFRIDSFRIAAVMDPRISWVQANQANDYRLAHEQIHFDITELYTRKLKTRLDPLVNTSVVQNADSADYIFRALNALLQNANTITNTVQDEMNLNEDLYDTDTDHSVNTVNQAAWASCVTNWINTNSLIGTCQMPTTMYPYPTPAIATCTPTTNSSAPQGTTNSTGTVTVTSPNGGECFQKGTTHQLTWTNSSNIDNVAIMMVSQSAGSFYLTTANIANTGSYSWTIPSTTAAGQYKALIIGYQTGVGNLSDSSDISFTVY